MTRLALVVALGLLAPATASAQALVDRGPPAHRLIHRSLIALRANPTGLVFDGRLGYRLRLFENDSLALRDNYAGVGLAANLSPAFLRAGPYVEIAPASIATVWASFQYTSYFGTFNLLQSFDSPSANFSDDEIERRGELPEGDPLEPYSAGGWELTTGLDLQARFGSIAVRTSGRLVRADLDLREGDTTYYDQLYDLLMPDAGWTFTNDLDGLYLAMGGRLAVGLRYTASVPLYPSDAYQPGEAEEHENTTQRLGLLAAYSFYSRDGAALNAPTLILLAQWWLDHRYRTGEETSQALPLIGLAFRVHGDFLALD